MTTPSVYNLRTFAFDIVNAGDTAAGVGNVRLMLNGDSLSSNATGNTGRLPAGIRDMWVPYRWNGWYSEVASVNQNNNPAANVPGWLVTPFTGAVTGIAFNGYAFTGGASGAQYQTNTGGTDTTAGAPALLNTVNTDPRPGAFTFAPHSYRDLCFNANLAANADLVQFQHDYRTFRRFQSTDQPARTATIMGDWTAKGDVVTARLIYYQNTNAPAANLIWRAYRNNTAGNSTTFNGVGAASIQYVDVNFATSTTSSLNESFRPRLRSDAAIVNYTGAEKVLPLVGLRYFRPNTTGLELSTWAQPGWNIEMFNGTSGILGTDTINSTDLAGWLTALDHPTHWMFFLGQNLSSASQTALNASDRTVFKAEYRTHINRVLAAYTANGQPAPKMLFISPQALTFASMAASSRTDLTYSQLDTAIYEIAAEYGGSFISLYQSPITEVDSSDDITGTGSGANNGQIAYSNDEVHQAHAGSMIWAARIWGAMKGALDIPARNLRGRGG